MARMQRGDDRGGKSRSSRGTVIPLRPRLRGARPSSGASSGSAPDAPGSASRAGPPAEIVSLGWHRLRRLMREGGPVPEVPSPCPPPPEPIAGAAPPRTGARGDDSPAALRDKARRWRMKAAEYHAVADALPLYHSAARESYVHLAHAYNALADRYDAFAERKAGERQPQTS